MTTIAPSGFRQLLDAAPDAMIVVDQDARVTALNPEAERLLGWTEDELRGAPMNRFIPARFHRLLEANLDGEPEWPPVSAESGRLSCFARRRDGSESPVELVWREMREGAERQALVTLRDLTQWRRAQEHRSPNKDEAQETLDSIGDAVITTDATGTIMYLNRVAERLTGWAAEEALGHSLDAVLPLLSEASRQPVANSATRCLQEGRSIDLEDGVVLLRRDGTEIPIGDSAAPIRDRHGSTTGVVLVIQDESEKRRVGHRLSFEATHDALTGLINRREFERRLSRVVNDLAGGPGEHVLLCLDLDRLKLVNDTSGHDAGDDLLRGLSAVLSRNMRKRDTLARLGGDEFGVLLENCPRVEAERIAENLRSEVEQFHFQWEGRVFPVSASVGLTPVTVGPAGIAAVLRAADAACYVAKEGGGNRVHFEPDGKVPAARSQTTARRVTRLARAVEEGHFRLYGQPIVPLQPEHPVRPRFEVLLRLPDGEGRIQDAADFLPQATRYNLMTGIDRWVIRETITLLGQWHRENPGLELPVASINLSAAALVEDSLILLIEQQLSRNGIPAETLCFEIGETAALTNLARTVRFFSGIRATGCALALEDFGSGVTSFTYLKTLAVDFLKIGGQVVREVAGDPLFGSIVGAIDRIGRSMGISTIAKQVDTQPALLELRTLGIGYAQGRALTPPVPLTDSEGRLALGTLVSGGFHSGVRWRAAGPRPVRLPMPAEVGVTPNDQ